MSSQADTFERSCAHWSDEARAEMEAFYELARVDYRYLAQAFDWAGCFRTLAPADRPMRLIDIACGSGKFPEALLAHAGLDGVDGLNVAYDLLDPSDFSIREASQVLHGPFRTGDEFCCTLQDWPVPEAPYELAWATHALYCVPADELEAGLVRMIQGLAPGGLGLVAQGMRDGHYVGFYDLFCEAFLDHTATPYSDGGQVEQVLRQLGVAVRMHELRYTTVVPAAEEKLLESYLHRCAFDDTVSLEQMRATEPVAAYLNRSFDPTARAWVFRQRVGLVSFAHREEDLGSLVPLRVGDVS